MDPRFAIVGCYTTADRRGQGLGIEVFALDPQHQRWRHLATTPADNPSYLVMDAAQRTLYVAHGAMAAISAYRFDAASGALTLLGVQDAGGVNPVHLVLTPDGRHLLAANYSSGTLAALPILTNGALAPPRHRLQLAGRPGPVAGEQKGPHPHNMPLSPSGRWLVVPDKGLDKIFVVQFAPDADGFSIATETIVAAGSGPRHARFHPTLPRLYVNHELTGRVATYAFDDRNGRLLTLGEVAGLPARFDGWNASGDMVISPTGRRLYVSNRGHDSIAEFEIDAATGRLGPARWRPSGGHFPRFLALSPDGGFLHAANQDGGVIARHRLGLDGALGEIDLRVETGSPACIVFAG